MQGGGNENTKIIRQFYVVWSNSPLSMIFRMDKFFFPLTKYATSFEQPKLQTLPLNSPQNTPISIIYQVFMLFFLAILFKTATVIGDHLTM